MYQCKKTLAHVRILLIDNLRISSMHLKNKNKTKIQKSAVQTNCCFDIVSMTQGPFLVLRCSVLQHLVERALWLSLKFHSTPNYMHMNMKVTD